MPQHLRDVTTDDLPAITAIYRDSVLNGTASYEITPPDLKEMTARFTPSARRAILTAPPSTTPASSSAMPMHPPSARGRPIAGW